MFSLVLKTFVIVVALLMVGFNPAVHMLKHFDSATARYNIWETLRAVRPEIRDGSIIFFTNDRFLPPFIDFVFEYYGGAKKVEAHWVFPYLIGGRELEKRTISDFVCFAADHRGQEIIWALDTFYVKRRTDETKRVIIELGDWRKIEVEFAYRDVLHEFFDGVFVRGKIVSIRQTRDENRKDIDRPLLVSGETRAGCASLAVR